MSVLVRHINELSGFVLSYARECPPMGLVDFLRRAHGQRRIHWENEREARAFAGYGATLDLVANGAERFEDIELMMHTLWEKVVMLGDAKMPILFGGFAFRDDFTPETVWQGMEGAQFVLPEVLLLRDGTQHWLIYNVYVERASQITEVSREITQDFEQLFDDLFWNYADDVWNPEWEEASDIEYPMSLDSWRQMIQTAQTHMQSGALEKVVLARMCQIQFNNPVNVMRALEYLRGAYADCYRFLFEPQAHHAFYGATPETLVRVAQKQLFADALAGTVRRGQQAAEDAQLATQLLSDAKERAEHDFVVQGLKNQLANVAQGVHASEAPVILKLSNVQHLHTPVTATLHEAVGVLPMVALLHPTAALGGAPKALAQSLIQTLEPISRGWYAAPIGWVDAEMNGHFVVAIRSAVCRSETLWCYAGAGVVTASVAEHEWVETDLKFRPMLNALGIQHDRARA